MPNTLSQNNVLSLIKNPDFVYEVADFKRTEFLEFDVLPVTDQDSPDVKQKFFFDYCLSVFHVYQPGLELDFYLNFHITINKTDTGYNVVTNPHTSTDAYLLTLSEHSSLIEGMNSEQTEAFLTQHLDVDQRVVSKILGTVFTELATLMNQLKN